jgi:hypothetical protein
VTASADGGERRHHLEEFGDGEIQSRHGIVNAWLLVVYTALALWGVYYLLTYWGGLGPGLAQ